MRERIDRCGDLPELGEARGGCLAWVADGSRVRWWLVDAMCRYINLSSLNCGRRGGKQ